MADILWDVACLTDPGRVRPRNEDVVGWLPRPGGAALVLADGMARHAGGDVASALVVEAALSALGAAEGDPRAALHEALRRGHDAVVERARQEPDLRGMGTTAVAALLDRRRVTWLHAGDSPLYWLRGGAVLLRSRDHSVTQVLVELGQLAPEAAASHPMAGQLTSSLGAKAWESVELSPEEGEGASFEVELGDVVLLCSDGLTGELGDAQIVALACATGQAAERARRLVDAALEAGGRDNVSVAVAVAGAARRRPGERRSPRRRAPAVVEPSG